MRFKPFVAVSALTALLAPAASTPTVTCIVLDDPAARIYRLRPAGDGWTLGLRHKELGDDWLELKLPGAEPVFQTGSARLSYRNANGGRQVDLIVGDEGSSLDVWVDHGLEVNIEPDLDPRIDLMNTHGSLRSLRCSVDAPSPSP